MDYERMFHIDPNRSFSDIQEIEETKKKIFPIYIQDVHLSYPSDLLILLKFSSVNIDKSSISKSMIEYLIKYKKFMDSDCIYSMALEPEIDFINFAIKNVIQHNIAGDIVEAGVWRGGMGIWMNYLLHKYTNHHRKIWLFDSYDEFPMPQNSKDLYVHPVTKILYEKPATIQEVKDNFSKFNLLTTNLYFVKGKYEKSVPNVDIQQISILHLDSDYYEPTLLMLEYFYKKISPGGYVIVNNYYDDHICARRAVDEYIAKNKIITKFGHIGNKYIYWRV